MNIFGFGNDITKVREQVKLNLKLIQKEKVQEEIKQRLQKHEEKLQPLAWFFLGLVGLSAISSDFGREIGEGFKKMEDKLNAIADGVEKFPFDLSYCFVSFIEIFFAIENQESKNSYYQEKLQQVMDRLKLLEGEDEKNPLIFDTERRVLSSDPNFDLVFAFTLRQTPILKIDAFLNYHLKSYDGDFKNFLESLLIEFEEGKLLLPKTENAVNNWLSKNQITKELYSKAGLHKSDDEKMKIVLEELDWLKHPTAQGEKIMFLADWNRLVEYTKVLVTKNEISNSIQPIMGVSYNGFMAKNKIFLL